MPRRTHAWLSTTACATACAAALAQPCAPYWTRVGGMRAGYGSVVTFDDGSGPALYASNIEWTGPCGVTVGRWDGRRWTVLDQGLLPSGGALWLAVLDEGLGAGVYARGSACGSSTPPYWLRRWNGQSWDDPSPNFFIYSYYGYTAVPWLSFNDGAGMATYGTECLPNTFCDGNGIVRWSGSAWIPLGRANLNGSISILAAADVGQGKRLFVAGVFSSIAGIPAAGVAMWNGASWEPLGIGINGRPRAMCEYDDGRGPALYIGGNMTLAGPAAVRGIARWDGQSWSDVGGGITSGGIAQINGLTTFDDGRGNALYASGYFSHIGGINANAIARWDGHTWEPLGAGLSSFADSFATFDDGRGRSLFMQGTFGYAGGGITGGLTQWVGCPNCYANCDNSTLSPRLNVLDFICFLNKFAARDPYVNCTVDGTIDIADFICFLNKFAAGCP